MRACAGCEKNLTLEDRVYFVYFVDAERVVPVVGAQVGGPLCYACYWGEDPISDEAMFPEPSC